MQVVTDSDQSEDEPDGSRQPGFHRQRFLPKDAYVQVIYQYITPCLPVQVSANRVAHLSALPLCTASLFD